ncbi:MAG: hypothetical protein RBR74_04205, partial [Ignavibacteriaceae bacterium]|nr:hypothetical protein [Ignavibacteriaceae bacterium]
MKIGFYIHHSNINAGGIYIYSKAILNLLTTTEKIKSIVIFTTPKVKELLGESALNPKIYFQIIDNNAFFYKTRLALSYFIYDFTIIYEIKLKKHNYLKWLKRFSVLINPYYFKLKRSGVSLFHVPIQY